MVLGWHAVAYLIFYVGVSFEVLIHGLDDGIDRPQTIADIWEDLLILHKLQHGTFPLSILAMERDMIGHRITRFRWDNGLLFQLWPDRARRIVPMPDQRASLVRQMHEVLGHFGIRMTHSMLHGQYWWICMYEKMAAYIGRCEVCDLFRSSFYTLLPQLQPLPIMGLGYRWLLDFARPLVVTSRGAKYVLVIVEHLASELSLLLYPKTLQSWLRSPF